jgi:hypothetical protein
MENASKALLIAGAILIAILLIALGMMAYTAGKAQVEKSSTSLDQSQVQSLNAQFVSFQGTKSGSEVRSLISLVKQTNSNIDSQFHNVNQGRGILLNSRECNNNTTEAQIIPNNPGGAGVSLNRNYTINIQYEANTGLVSNITINPA